MPGIATSDMRRSGDLNRAAANASNGHVKNFAENPFICNMAARVDAMTGSSSTTKICGAEQGNTWFSFPNIVPTTTEASAGGRIYTGVSMI
jgi:hypothetical protein